MLTKEGVMEIWHVGALPSPHRVNGTNTVVWPVAREQAILGHHVTLVLDGPPDNVAWELAKQCGINLLEVPASTWRYSPKVLIPLLDSKPPDLVHMHATYFPKQATLARHLLRRRIPYIVTPHGGLYRQSKRLKKSVYVRLVEKPRLQAASAITVVSEQEKELVRTDVPRFGGIVRLVRNPTDVESLGSFGWNANVRARRLVFLGRFHVVHKGLDILVDIARFIPSAEFHLYGDQETQTRGQYRRLRRRLPPNVHFHSPVFGTEKAKVLSEASLYIQTSRWEVFGMSIAEAMYLGVPCAISHTSDLAEHFLQQDLGFVLPATAKEAALRLHEVLAQPPRLRHWSQRAQSFARERFNPRTIASNYLELYEEVLS